MTSRFWTGKPRGFIIAIAIVAGAACLSFAATAPKPVPVAALGSDWQCSRTAFVVTTCTRVRHTEPVVQNLRKESIPRV